MNKIILSLGSNIGDLNENLNTAINMIKENCTVLKISSFIKTEPMEFKDQPDFLNAALIAETELCPHSLLAFLKNIEIRVGRKKNFRYGPRKIDIDIIFYNDSIIESNELTIPHPKAHVRDFVLRPLQEISPDLMHPILKKSISNLLEELK